MGERDLLPHCMIVMSLLHHDLHDAWEGRGAAWYWGRGLLPKCMMAMPTLRHTNLRHVIDRPSVGAYGGAMLPPSFSPPPPPPPHMWWNIGWRDATPLLPPPHLHHMVDGEHSAAVQLHVLGDGQPGGGDTRLLRPLHAQPLIPAHRHACSQEGGARTQSEGEGEGGSIAPVGTSRARFIRAHTHRRLPAALVWVNPRPIGHRGRRQGSSSSLPAACSTNETPRRAPLKCRCWWQGST